MFILQGGSPFVYVCFNPHLSLNQQAKTPNVNLGPIIIFVGDITIFTIFHNVSPCFTIFQHVSPCFLVKLPFFRDPGPPGENHHGASGARRGNWWPLASSPHRCRTVRWPTLGPKKPRIFWLVGNSNNIWVCLKIVYPYTQWLMIIIPTKWL